MFSQTRRWARFLTAYIPDDYLPVVVGIAMAWHPGAGPEFWLRAGIVLFGAVALSLFIHGADNIAGFQLGVDRIASERKRAVKEPKLLVTGEVGLREAKAVTAALLVFVLAAMGYVAATSHWTATVLAFTAVFLTAQYSVGLRLSYRGLGETMVGLAGLGTPVAFGVLAHRFDWGALIVGIMLGFFFAAVNVCSNQADYEFDRDAARGTLAVRLGLIRHSRLALGVAAAAWTTFLIALAVGALPQAAIVMLILVRRHVRQFRTLLAGDPITARRMGFATLRMVFVFLTLLFVADHALA